MAYKWEVFWVELRKIYLSGIQTNGLQVNVLALYSANWSILAWCWGSTYFVDIFVWGASKKPHNYWLPFSQRSHPSLQYNLGSSSQEGIQIFISNIKLQTMWQADLVHLQSPQIGWQLLCFRKSGKWEKYYFIFFSKYIPVSCLYKNDFGGARNICLVTKRCVCFVFLLAAHVSQTSTCQQLNIWDLLIIIQPGQKNYLLCKQVNWSPYSPNSFFSIQNEGFRRTWASRLK